MNLLESIKRKLGQTFGGAVQAVKNLFQPKIISPLAPAPKQPAYKPPSFNYASPKVIQNTTPTVKPQSISSQVSTNLLPAINRLYQTQVKPIFQPAYEGIKMAMNTPPPTFNFPQIKNPYLKTGAETLANLPGAAWKSYAMTPFTGVEGIKETGGNILKLAQGQKVTPQEILSGYGKIGEAALNLYTGGKGTEVKEAAKQLGEEKLIPTLTKGFKSAFPYGLGYGFSGATQTGKDIQSLPEYGKHLVTGTLGGGLLAGGIGAGGSALGYGINKGVKLARSSYENQMAKQFSQDVGFNKIELTQHPVIKDYIRAFNIDPLTEKEVISAVDKIKSGYIGDPKAMYDLHTITNENLPILKRLNTPDLAQVWDYILSRKNGSTPDMVPPQLQALDKSITDYAGKVVGQSGFLRWAGSDKLSPVEYKQKLKDRLTQEWVDLQANEAQIKQGLRGSLGDNTMFNKKKNMLKEFVKNPDAFIENYDLLPPEMRVLPKTPVEAIKPAKQYKPEDLFDLVKMKEAPSQPPSAGVPVEKPIALLPERTATPDPIQLVINAIKEAKPTREAQEALYTQIRGQKMAGAEQVGQQLGGEAGFYKKLGVFKGEMPKVQFTSIRDKLCQQIRDTLFNRLETSKNLGEWEKLPAGKGLAKLLGEYGGQVPTRGELDLLDKEFGKEFVDTILSKRSNGEKLSEWFGQGVNVPKSLLSSFDMSMPFRQGIFFLGKPKQFLGAFKEQFKTFFSEKALQQSTEEIASRPTFKFMQDRVSLTNLGTDLTKREEQYMSTWAEKIPGIGKVVRASTRAAVGFLNKLRADVFDDLYYNAERAGLDPANNKVLLDNFAKLINNGTGRGGLGALEKAAVVLNQTLFSPRLVASRLNILNPKFYLDLDSFTRKEALKTLFGTTSILMSTMALAKFNGAKVEVDPRSADFSKIKVGNTRYEITGGFSQYIRLAAQLLSGKIISSTTGREYTLGEGYKPLTKYDILQRFFEYKEAPILSFAIELLRGQNVFGGKPEWGEEVANRFIPMIIQDMSDLVKDRGMAGLFMGVPGIFGVGVQTYSEAESIKNMMTEKQKEQYKTYGEPYVDVVSKNKDLSYEDGKIKQLYEEGKPLTPDISEKTKSEFLYGQLKEAQSLIKYGKGAEATKIINDLKKAGLATPELVKRMSILEQADKAGLSKTDRSLVEYQGQARAIKIKENLDGMKDPKAQYKKLDLLIKTGIVDAETKQGLRELYGLTKKAGGKVTALPALAPKNFKATVNKLGPLPPKLTPGGQVPMAMDLIKKYFPPDQWNNAYRVMMGESGGNPMAIGDNYPIRGEVRPSYGLFQIRTFPDRPAPTKLLTPEANVAYAAKMWKSQGWRPWTAATKLGIR